MKLRELAVVALLIGLFGCESRLSTPEKSIDEQVDEALKQVDPTIIYTRQPLSRDENAFPLWEAAFERLVKIEEEDLKHAFEAVLGERSPFPVGETGRRLADWLTENEEALGLVDAGIRRAKCQFPEIRGKQSQMSYFAPLCRVARMKLATAKMLASAQDFEPAGEELAAILRLGELTVGGDGRLYVRQAGTVIQWTATEGIRWLAQKRGLPEKVLERLIGSLKPLSVPDRDLARTFQVEFSCIFVPQLRYMAREAAKPENASKWLAQVEASVNQPTAAENAPTGAMPPKSLVDITETLEIASHYAARGIRNTTCWWKDRDRNILTDRQEQWQQWAREAVPCNLMGRYLVGELLCPFSLYTTFHTRAHREATRAVLALRLYEMRHGELPHALRALVDEKILEAVPVDPFSSGPLPYSRDRRIVWSVGRNESGDGRPGRWSGKDYVWRIPEGR